MVYCFGLLITFISYLVLIYLKISHQNILDFVDVI